MLFLRKTKRKAGVRHRRPFEGLLFFTNNILVKQPRIPHYKVCNFREYEKNIGHVAGTPYILVLLIYS